MIEKFEKPRGEKHYDLEIQSDNPNETTPPNFNYKRDLKILLNKLPSTNHSYPIDRRIIKDYNGNTVFIGRHPKN